MHILINKNFNAHQKTKKTQHKSQNTFLIIDIVQS